MSSMNNTPYQSASLYVGDLTPDITEAFLYEVFREVGPIVSIKVCRDALTRKSLGYAYVNFQNSQDAERALDTLNYTTIKDKPIRIMWSQRDPTIRKSGVGNIFIKNLDKTIDNKALYDTFSAFGNILSCKVEQMKNKDGTVESLGYGYVHFETQEAAEQAIEKVNGMLINGKKVYVGPFLKKTERIKKNSAQKFTNIYVKDLPKDLNKFNDKDMEELFSKYGEVTSSIIMCDKDGKSKGFGFVNFKNHEEAKNAVDGLNGKEIEGKPIFVGRAQKKSERRAQLKQQFMNKYQGVNLYVKNLDDSFDDKKLQEAFAPFGNITSCRVMTDENGNSRGFGFVCFTKPEEATKAITEMNGRMVGNKPLYVTLAQRKEIRKAQLEAQYAQRAGLRPGMPQPMFAAHGAPVFYPPQPGMPQQGQRPGFVYTPQMMRPRWATGQQPRPGQYPVPMVNQRGAKNNRPNQRRGYKYNQNARNRPGEPTQPTQQQQRNVPQQQQQPTMDQRGDVLTPEYLAQCSPDQQKQLLGERLFPLVHLSQPALASKITGMLLEMDNADILHLLESDEALNAKIIEAVNVLKAHEVKEKQTTQEEKPSEENEEKQ